MPDPLKIAFMIDYIAPAVAAVVFVAVMHFVRDPTRRTVNAFLLAGASGVYMSAGAMGLLEVPFAFTVLTVAYFALRDYRFVALGWFLHAGWDIIHHRLGHPIWPFMPSSSLGCLVFDSLIGLWFLALGTLPAVSSFSARASNSPACPSSIDTSKRW